MPDAPVPLLLVDDSPANLLALEAVLDDPGWEPVRAASGGEALRLAGEREFAVVLLDLRLPDLDGFAVARRLRSAARHPDTPVIFLTAADTQDFPVEEAYTLGAVDYLVKPFAPAVLRAKVAVFAELYQKAARVRELERRAADARLAAADRRRDEELRLVADAVPALIAYVGADYRYRFANRRYEDWFGRSPDDVRGRHMREVVGDAAFARIRGYTDRALSGEEVSFEAWVPYTTGPARFIHARYVPHTDGGRVAGFFALVTDVTERQREQDALRDREALLRSIGDNLPGGAVYQVSATPDGGRRFSHVSAGVEQILGVPPTEALADAAAIYGLILSEDAPRVAAAEEEALAARAPFDCEFRCRTRAGGVRWLHCRSAPREVAGGAVVWDGVMLDVTARKGMEAELAERDRRKDEFLATLAHELRNPLAPVLNALYLLRAVGGRLPAEVHPAVGVLDRQVGYLARMVDDLLDISRVSRGKLDLRREDVDLREVARVAAETAQPLVAAARHDLAVDVPSHPVWVNGDPARLAQVAANLLNNAAKYTPDGGRITVTVAVEAGGAVLRVADTGIGIEPDALRRVFELFEQAFAARERAQGGLGIGLSLVKRLVELHGGAVEAHSGGPGTGSTFVVRLPLAAPAD